MPLVWAVGQQVGRQAIAVVSFLVMARFLTPADIGTLGVATIWVGLLQVFGDLGFSAAVVQRRDLTPAHLSAAFWMNVASAIVLVALSAVLAGPTAQWLQQPAAAPVIRWLSLGLLVTSLSTVMNARALRAMQFRGLAVRDMIATLAGVAVGIPMAVWGYGLWSLVAQTLVTSIGGTVLMWAMPEHRFHVGPWTRAAAADLWAFGSRLLGFGLFKYLVKNVDAALIGFMLGPAALGVYLFAQRLALQPIAGLEQGIGTFLFARAAAVQDDKAQVARLYLAAFGLTNALLVAWALVIAVAGPALLGWYFGPKWQSALALLGLFGIMVVARAPTATLGNVLKALGDAGWLLHWSIGQTAASVIALLVALPWGLGAGVAAMAAVQVLSLGYVAWTARDRLGIPIVAWLGAGLSAYGVAAFLIALSVGASRLVSHESVALAVVFATVVALTLLSALRWTPLYQDLMKEHV
jgi:O-antigen/teichoic acid export membrane protein